MMSSIEKRRIQNREAQRRHRSSLKTRLAELEAARAFLQQKGYSLPAQVPAHPGTPASQQSLSPPTDPLIPPDWVEGHSGLLDSDLTVLPGTGVPDGSVGPVTPGGNATWMRTLVQDSRFTPIDSNYYLKTVSPGWRRAAGYISTEPESTPYSPTRAIYPPSPMSLHVPPYQEQKMQAHPPVPLTQHLTDALCPTESPPRQNDPWNHTSNPKGRRGPSPLHIAVLNLSLASVQVLCQYGADVHALDEDGRTALHLCAGFPVQHGELASEMTSLLVLYGASLEARDDEGETSMQRAARVGNYMLISTLAGLGADVNF
ncbi:hypothetical protein N7463_008520 [Penicillium fimorum]|uniref:BZIP domain-containing protein n=1 Tax=Penicillium fimorum TaxID=1882269 RepID=A0A9W9XP13_9EURO|nr:hypothetical protein N7463_008520 [Penicillium fimorum]